MVLISIPFVFVQSSASFQVSNSVPKRSEVVKAAEVGDAKALKRLLDAGADVDTVERDGYTILMVAAVEGRSSVVDLLIRRKANLNRKDIIGGSALSYAAFYGRRG